MPLAGVGIGAPDPLAEGRLGQIELEGHLRGGLTALGARNPKNGGHLVRQGERVSRKGDCWDNAAAESFFATVKREALGDDVPNDHDLATRTIGDYIDAYYTKRRHSFIDYEVGLIQGKTWRIGANTKRRHSFIDYESPIEFELKRQLATMAA